MMHYYKTKDGHGYFCLKKPSSDRTLIRIAQSEFNEHMKAKKAEEARQEAEALVWKAQQDLG